MRAMTGRETRTQGPLTPVIRFLHLFPGWSSAVVIATAPERRMERVDGGGVGWVDGWGYFLFSCGGFWSSSGLTFALSLPSHL